MSRGYCRELPSALVQSIEFPEDNMPENLPLEEFSLRIPIVSPCVDERPG